MIKLLLLTAVLFLLNLIPQNSSAQSKWHKGIIVTNQGDTIKGFIDFRDSRLNPKSIFFSVKEDGNQSKKLSPSDIKGFAIEGEQQYKSYIGPVSTNSVSLDKLLYSDDRNFYKIDLMKDDTVFLMQLISGKANLFELEDFKFHYFFQYGNGPVFELLNKFYMVSGTREYKANDKVYLRQIDSLMHANDISTLSYDDLQKISFSKQDLSKLALLLNGSSGNTAKTMVYKKRKIEQRLGVGGGISFLTLDHSNQYLANRKSKSTNPQVNLHYDFSGIANLNGFFGRIEAQCQRLNLDVNDYHTNYIQKYTATVTNISIIPSVNFAFIKQSVIEAYAGFGVSVNFNLQNSGAPWNFSDTLYNANGTPVGQIAYSEPHKIRSVWPNVHLHAGAVFAKKIELDISYDLRTTATNAGDSENMRFESLSLKLNYIFRL